MFFYMFVFPCKGCFSPKKNMCSQRGTVSESIDECPCKYTCRARGFPSQRKGFFPEPGTGHREAFFADPFYRHGQSPTLSNIFSRIVRRIIPSSILNPPEREKWVGVCGQVKHSTKMFDAKHGNVHRILSAENRCLFCCLCLFLCNRCQLSGSRCGHRLGTLPEGGRASPLFGSTAGGGRGGTSCGRSICLFCRTCVAHTALDPSIVAISPSERSHRD